jgi:hypothetical protein
VFNNLFLGTGLSVNNGNGHLIANNTIIASGLAVSGATGLVVPTATIENNYISGSGTQSGGEFITANYDITYSGLAMDYNVYAYEWGYHLWWYPSTTTGTWATYLANSGSWDQHSVNLICTFGGPCTTANQGGINQATGLPSNGAKTIRAGANLTSLGIAALDTDLAGDARPPTGAWDIGAFEASAPNPPTGLYGIAK